jgi:predicted anti-sigma-YlaC factor YlaD
VVPVFVDATGRRRRLMTGLGWLVALSCVVYLGVIGVSMTGTSVGSLPELPNVAPQLVVFGSQAAALPPGALESTLPAPAMTPRATAPQTQAPASSRARITGTSR